MAKWYSLCPIHLTDGSAVKNNVMIQRKHEEKITISQVMVYAQDQQRTETLIAKNEDKIKPY